MRQEGAATRIVVGAVLFANADYLLLIDRTLFEVPNGMSLPALAPGRTVVVEFEVVNGRNILTHVPGVRVQGKP